MKPDPIVIVSAARTPMGAFQGELKGFAAPELGAAAIRAAVERAKLKPDEVQEVLMGCVLPAGQGQAPARQAALGAGLALSTGCTTVNKMCGSGMKAAMIAHDALVSLSNEIIVAGGMESMTNAPHLLPGARAGYRIGDGTIVDSMMYDGLYCAFDQVAMGAVTEKYAQAHGLVREHMDAMAAESHRRADAAQTAGRYDNEIVPVTVPQRRGDALVVGHDEGVRGETTIESLAGLRPAFDKAGHITAGNASQISDGASATIITTAEVADRLGVTPLAEIVGYGQVAGPDASLLHQPSRAIKAALDHAGLAVSDVDLFEINEAFAAVGVASADDLGIKMDIVNVNGGAIAMGHPLGMSGNRIALHLALELARRGGGTGAAALCGGGGQGDAIIVRTMK